MQNVLPALIGIGAGTSAVFAMAFLKAGFRKKLLDYLSCGPAIDVGPHQRAFVEVRSVRSLRDFFGLRPVVKIGYVLRPDRPPKVNLEELERRPLADRLPAAPAPGGKEYAFTFNGFRSVKAEIERFKEHNRARFGYGFQAGTVPAADAMVPSYPGTAPAVHHHGR
jgi:hypothetical protein